MTRSVVMDQIKELFHYLFEDYGFTVFSETYFESFGNWVIVLLSNGCRIRFFEDRGEVSIAVGPLWSPADWQAGPWFDLPIVIAYLTNEKDTWEYKSGSTAEQLERLAGLLRPSCDQICELFEEDVFQQRRRELESLEKQRYNQLWDKLT